MTRSLTSHKNEQLGWEDLLKEVKDQVSQNYQNQNPGGLKYTDGSGREITQTTQTVYAFSLGKRAGLVQGPVFGARGLNNGGRGVKITEVVPGSPAQRAGFEVGDIILSINGNAIASEQEYSDAVDNSGPVMRVDVINRKNQQVLHDIKVTLNRP
ncbi:MAG: PDZ domain-containing protein [Planctomycetes bacterium]|nr:PDZ domain-containing protein [Planctomycetota bacterium]